MINSEKKAYDMLNAMLLDFRVFPFCGKSKMCKSEKVNEAWLEKSEYIS